MLDDLVSQLSLGRELSQSEIGFAVTSLIDDRIPALSKAEFLIALARKGETPAEIAAFAQALRLKSVSVPVDDIIRQQEILDVCGTGGDRLNTFNISTATALVASAAGVTVAKHGNRAVTSQAGSADVLEEFGIPITLLPAEAALSLRNHRFAFLFAPLYHPAFKHIAAARSLCAQRQQRTIFNFLGPLLNPALPSAQLIGVPRPELCKPLALVLQSLGVRRGMVVCGSASDRFLDELSPLGLNTIAEFSPSSPLRVSVCQSPGLPPTSASLADLVGGDRAVNASIIRNILTGSDRGIKRDAVLFNAGAALLVAGLSASLAAGVALAGEVIDAGLAREKLLSLGRSSS